MKKIEIIWRHILEHAAKQPTFEQKELAEWFKISTSTVHAALSSLREIGAVAVTGRNFRVTNLEKILMFWATHRNLKSDIIYETKVDLPVLEIEGLVDNETIFGTYSAGRLLLGQAPADYDQVYLYHSQPLKLSKRFPKVKGDPNLRVLKSDPFLATYGKITPSSQTFVDLWNLRDWYAQDFFKALKEKYYGLL